ncbi:hypothetical protein [Clostridium mediterraneense]|uniref:hypothetical protein n=1 Tax=Clostridium mediterraneense TaxID=1805472 RepID=UPI00082FD36C|nr:hypothetical protein [Clostridium mediterraneense]
MLEIKIESDNKGALKFRANVDEKLKDNMIIKRAIFESRTIKSNKKYPYIIPMKFFIPLIRNINNEFIKLDSESVVSFLEFSDEYEEEIYYNEKATAVYMKKWRDEGCPEIFKIIIDRESLDISKEVVFRRLI